MLAFQLVARLQVIELLLGRLPVNQGEVFSVVLQMAPHAVFPIEVSHSQLSMVAVIRNKALRDLLMAIEALEGGHAGAKLVTTRALRGPA